MSQPSSHALPLFETTVEERISWASAFVDGEVTLSDSATYLSETVHEQLYYYTLTRQVLRGTHQPTSTPADFQSQRVLLARFWASVDADSASIKTGSTDLT